MKRIFMVLAVTVVMAMLLAALAVPAMAKVVKPDGPAGPPSLSGQIFSFPKTMVAHCEDGGVAVFNKKNKGGGGDCRIFPQE